jgi:iron complex transport system substrate-binding protein
MKLKLTSCVLLGIVLILAACAPVEPIASGAVVDDLGRSVNIEKVPQRIISLAPSNTELLFALGLGDKIVGVTEYCDYPPEALEKEKVGGYSTPDIEKIIALEPDLILASSIHAKEIIPALEERGLIVFALEPENLDGILADIRVVGEITGSEKEASELVTQMESRIKAVTDKTQSLKPEERPKVFYITWHEPLWSVGSETIIHELIEKAGGENIFQDITGHKMVNLETVIARNPEVIIACTGTGEAKNKPYEWAKEEPRLMVTEAYKNDRIYQVDADLVSRTGPRIVEALEEFARFIHPEIFSKSSMLNYPMEIVDQMGRTVTVRAKPARIISLSTANTEILFALGAGSSIIGVDSCSKQDLKETMPELEGVSEVGEFANLDIEKIIALVPDLVLAVPYQKQAVERLGYLGLPVVVLEATSIEAVLNDIKLIGRIVDREEDTSTLISNMEQRLKNIAEKTSNLAETEKPTALYLYEPLWVACSNTMANDLIQKAGGVNIFSDLEGYKEVDLEAIIARDPQVIFCVQGYTPTLEYVMGETRLEEVAAVRNGRVYGIQAALVDIPGPGIIDALELIAEQLHPELFGEGR